MTVDSRRTVKDEDGRVTYHLALTDEQWAAWNVRSSLGMDAERTVGGARLVPFTVSADQSKRDLLRSELSASRGGRWTPPDDYVMLEIQDDEGGWDVMMSDTPDEANDHAEAIAVAWLWGGRILIHGLGLGCYLNTVLASAHVEHVDVVEISQDVIDLTAPYFQGYVDEGRLTIHHDNALTKKWPVGSFWDVVWHDVWKYIAAYNLTDPSEAENGVTYATMHRKFAGRCHWQGSWGHPQALWMRRQDRRLEAKAAEWSERWNNSTFDERIVMLAEVAVPHMPADRWLAFLEMQPEDDHAMLAQYRRIAKRTDKMTPDEAYVIIGRF
jgi:hypothetical protein